MIIIVIITIIIMNIPNSKSFSNSGMMFVFHRTNKCEAKFSFFFSPFFSLSFLFYIRTAKKCRTNWTIPPPLTYSSIHIKKTSLTKIKNGEIGLDSFWLRWKYCLRWTMYIFCHLLTAKLLPTRWALKGWFPTRYCADNKILIDWLIDWF